jgi:hypothetical protein
MHSALQGSRQIGLGPFPTFTGRLVRIALRHDSTTVGLDDIHALSFDRSGRLIRAFWDRRSIRRSLDHRFVEKRKVGPYPWSVARRVLDPVERLALHTTIVREIAAVWQTLQAAHPLPDPHADDLDMRLTAILSWTPEALEADAERFRSVYLPIPILPPDQYEALVVQVTEGCAYNQCTFCRFYRDRTFRVKPPSELKEHIRAVRDFFGPSLSLRRSVFLADANALMLSPERLAETFDLVRRELPFGPNGLRGIYSFIDAFNEVPKSVDHFRVLADRGLRRAYVGLETGCDDLLRLLGKPGSRTDALALTRALQAAGVGVGIIVLLGVGGESYQSRHVEETLATLNAMALGPQDILYLSPLAADPDSPYRRQEREAGIRPLSEEEMNGQLSALRSGLRGGPAGRVKVAVYDIQDFLY